MKSKAKRICLAVALIISILPSAALAESSYFLCNGILAGCQTIMSHPYIHETCEEIQKYCYCTRYVNSVPQETNWHNHLEIRFHTKCTVSPMFFCGDHATTHYE